MNPQPLDVATSHEPQRRPATELLILDHVRLEAWDRVLFVECGDGWLVEEAWRRMRKGCACGLSTSPTLVDLAARLRGVPGQVEFKTWDGERLPLLDCSFDRVISCVPADYYVAPLAVLREIARVLRPDGDVYLPDRECPVPTLARALNEAGLQEVRQSRCDAVYGGQSPGAARLLVRARRRPSE